MLKKLEKWVNNSPLYNPVRYNPLTDAFIEIKNKKTKKNIDYYSSFLTPGKKLVFDIGANKGNKIKAFLKMGFDVVALEPEKKALSTLYWRYKNNKHVTIIEKGVSDTVANIDIHIADDRSGLNTLSDKWVGSLETEENRWEKKHAFKDSYTIQTTTLDLLISEYGMPYFIKIDVEGYENKVINGLHQLPTFISFETNLPEFKEESIECVQHLLSLPGQMLFNYSITDKLESDLWLSGDEMIRIINDPSIMYMEVIGKA
jgi:FkbM family methyltransferase